MKVLPLNLYTLKNKNSDNKNINFNSFQKINNPITDTVSFSANYNSETVKNTKKIYNAVKNGEFGKGLKILDKLKDGDWNPNYFEKELNNENKSIMGLLIDKFKYLKPSIYTAEGMLLFMGIISHPEFTINNKDSDGDLLEKAVKNKLPNSMVGILFEMSAFDDKKYKNYAEIFKLNGYDNLAEATEKTIEEFAEIMNSETKNSSNRQLKEYEDDEEINVEKFKIELGPQDPKSLDDVGGLEEIKEDIQRYIIKPWHPKYRERFEKHNIKRPSGVLFSGPPGCGKTFIAQAIAAETGYDFYYINLTSVGSHWAYDTSKNISSIFSQLEEKYKDTGEPSIVFLDEMDSIASSRENSAEDWKRDDVNALLTSINNSSQKGIILIGATNLYNALDKAATRSGRMDVVIKFKYPDKQGRKDIIEKLLKQDEISSGLVKYSEEFAEATENYTPAEISSSINMMCSDILTSDKETASKDDFYKALNVTARKRDMNDIKPVGFKNSN